MSIKTQPQTATLPSQLYAQAVTAGTLAADDNQQQALPYLDSIAQDLANNKPCQGAYLHGPVGRGKSVLMQLLFDSPLIENIPKRRVHFHPFMEELHTRLHETDAAGADLMTIIAADIAQESKLLCFDEFFVTNIADAMLLGRLLEALFKQGVVLCVTSNWAPDDLYQDGHNRGQFMPFMKIIKNHCHQLSVAGPTDFRTQSAPNTQPLPTGGNEVILELGKAEVSATDYGHNVYGFTFKDLCGGFLSRTEYMDLCEGASGVVITDVPQLTENNADAAMRFVVLIDLLYEANMPLRLTTNHDLDTLCLDGPVAFAYQRTRSRLHVLQGLPLPI